MKYLGIVSMGHDASLALVEDGEILFASHAERYSRKKNDPNINRELIEDAIQYGTPNHIVWYETPWKKTLRQLYAGQYHDALNTPNITTHLRELGLCLPTSTVGHHESHAAAGFYTSGFMDASILVADAIGEFTCMSIWQADGRTMKQVWKQSYPNSLGLLYSAFTHRLGLKPNEEEYIMMGMAALGDPNKYYHDIKNDFIHNTQAPTFELKHNVHRGIMWWRPELTSTQDHYDIAASIQKVTEEYLVNTTQWMKANLPSKNLILMGGVALNCKANTEIATTNLFDNIWIMPNPGDAGSSIGAVAAYTKQHINWKTPYLGHDINNPLDIQAAVTALVNGEVIGIANGRAEFGPRSLGNRSLIADPRGPLTKDKVNNIKKRELFRPFAPIVIEHLAHQYFNLPYRTTPYMQFTAPCIQPDLLPAICHYDNTSRVQTLNNEQNPIFYHLLTEFYKQTGCPILLNTSLNIKGQPLVNTWQDALDFQSHYGVRVF